ncbi:MAG: hypothetical protein IT450_01345 [Phycisphaerales bacterium]|nr:hypothetical protein [Phycisphaerales bacterium]
MARMQQLSLWTDATDQEAACLPAVPAESAAESAHQSAPSAAAAEATCRADSDLTHQSDLDETDLTSGPPLAEPLPEAIAAGVFGLEHDGPMEPDAEQIAALIHEHANELIGLLGEIEALQHAIRTGTDPRTGRAHRDAQVAVRAAERHTAELRRAETRYADALAAFEEGFGAEATRKLDEWVRAEVAGGAHKRGGYDPGHPWHYYLAGDNAPPIPFEQIVPCEDAGAWLERDLPRNPAKRVAKLRELLEREQRQLDEDRARYESIIARGAEALSRFDREIAHGGNDELARASALALKYNHIRLGLGRVRWLTTELRRFGVQAELGHAADRPSSK